MHMLESYHGLKLQDFLSSNEFRIENESKVYEFNIEVRNRTQLNLVGRNRKCIESKNLGMDPALVCEQNKNRRTKRL